MDINQKLTEELEVKRWQVDAAVKLIDPVYFKISKRSDRLIKR